ncbi:MAG TPA: serine/threonine-protein kinase [Gemmatimonadaceae bacterium]|nr:serine/threonine-protein kinase [Gemmatimonadaceae bacterium]
MSSPKICPQCGAEYELDQRFCPKDGTTLRLQNATGDLVGAIIADRYHVIGKLGEGGMGQVYLAEHVKMGRRSALKVMNPALVKDADAISRFNREAANASRINHPNVADVYDFGETPDGIIYLAMELVEGPTLTKVIEEQGPLPPSRVATIVRQASEALAVAHDMGIVHRDLKPDNIMLARNRDGSDCAKIVDFGIAKAADSAAQKVTKTGLVIGTPEYMSPEQLAGDTLDGRSDIYSLALVAFNMLTGKLPFPAETAQESMIMRLTEPPRKLVQMRPEIPWTEPVQAALDRALQRDVNARYASASEFGRALSSALEGMSAAPAPTPARAPETRSTGSNPTLPVTRVGPDRPGAPVREQPAAPASRPARRRYATALAAGGAALVVVLIGAAMVMNRPTGRLATGDSVTPARPATSDVKVSDPSLYARPMDSTPAGAAGSTPASSAAPTPQLADVGSALDSLEKVVSGDVTAAEAERVIRRVKEMKSRIKGDEQLVHAGIVIALGESSRGDNAAACAALRSVQSIAPATTRARQVERTMSVCN